jgi:hypothetical protein
LIFIGSDRHAIKSMSSEIKKLSVFYLFKYLHSSEK